MLVRSALPGYNGTLPSAQWSGYLPVGNLSKSPGMLHYWLIESENDPSTDPIVLWLNGGPGASGMIGMLTELGSFNTAPMPGQTEQPADGSGVPPLYHNKYGWTQAANLFTIEQPKGVGFSYCTSKPCVNTDLSTAQDTYEALVGFFAAFPQCKRSAAGRILNIPRSPSASVHIVVLILRRA
jgi:carboxypeptidase C (cathepsin A)